MLAYYVKRIFEGTKQRNHQNCLKNMLHMQKTHVLAPCLEAGFIRIPQISEPLCRQMTDQYIVQPILLAVLPV